MAAEALTIQRSSKSETSPLDKIVGVLRVEKYLNLAQIVEKTGLPQDFVVNSINDNLDKKGRQLFYDKTGGGLRLFALRPEVISNLIEDPTKKDISRLLNDAKFVTVVNILAKAIENATLLPHAVAEEQGQRWAYYCYIMQQHEAVAWDVKRQTKTLLEERLELIGTYVGQPERILESILRNTKAREAGDQEKFIEILDNILTRHERQVVYDLVPTGLVHGSQPRKFTLADGREWDYYTFRLDIQKVLYYAANKENVLRDILNKPEYLQVLTTLMEAGHLEAWEREQNKPALDKLEGLGLLKFIRGQDYMYTEAERVQLSPKILKYSPLLLNTALEEIGDRPFGPELERLNFDLNELRELGVHGCEDLQRLAQHEPAQSLFQFPTFFELDRNLITVENFRALLRKMRSEEPIKTEAQPEGEEISKPAAELPQTPKTDGSFNKIIVLQKRTAMPKHGSIPFGYADLAAAIPKGVNQLDFILDVYNECAKQTGASEKVMRSRAYQAHRYIKGHKGLAKKHGDPRKVTPYLSDSHVPTAADISTEAKDIRYVIRGLELIIEHNVPLPLETAQRLSGTVYSALVQHIEDRKKTLAYQEDALKKERKALRKLEKLL